MILIKAEHIPRWTTETPASHGSRIITEVIYKTSLAKFSI